MASDESVYIYGMASNVILLLIVIVYSYLVVKQNRRAKLRYSQTFYSFTIAFVVFFFGRTLWYYLTLTESDDHPRDEETHRYFSNRVAWLAFILLFMFVLLFWTSVYSRLIFSTVNYTLILKIIIWVIGLIFAFLSVYAYYLFYYTDDTEVAMKFYDISIYLISGMFLLVAAAFLIFGNLIVSNYRRIIPRTMKWSRPLTKIRVASVVLFVCFVVKSYFLTYRLLTGEKLPTSLYISGSYIFPEFFSVLTEIFLIYPPMTSVKAFTASERINT